MAKVTLTVVCRDLADRIRDRLHATGIIGGPALIGPGWATDRAYQAGDRVLLHTRLRRHTQLVNGTTATVTAVDRAGLKVRLANGDTSRLPAAFARGHKPDGAPNLSHSWARTIDGAQGGTWETCHLLGTSALDAYRGYTGQSRSRQPTHTWNTTPVITVDHGGVLADRRSTAEHVLAALARQPDPTMAARSDPWTVDHQLRARIAEHRAVLAAQPVDRAAALREADRQVADAEQRLTRIRSQLAGAEERTTRLGPLTALSRAGRRERDGLRRRHDSLTADTPAAEQGVRRAQAQHAAISAEQAAHEGFVEDNRWRHHEIDALEDELAHHWTGVMLGCVRAGYPLAFGIDRLRHARHTTHADLQAIEARIPIDHQPELQTARQASTAAAREVTKARETVATVQDGVTEARQRRRARRDALARAATGLADAQAGLDRAVAAKNEADGRLAGIRRHHQQRQQALHDTGPRRAELTRALADLDAALDHTRSDRVAHLAVQPDSTLCTLLGETPPGPAGQALWCEHAHTVETIRDHYLPTDTVIWHHLGRACDQARSEIAASATPTPMRNRGAPDIGPGTRRRLSIDHGM